MYKHRVEIKDGEALIVGHLYIPDEESDRPCVVISHEFGFDQNWESKYALELARRSYPVFTFDFPGSGNGCSKGRKTTEMSVITEVGDLKTVVGYLKIRLKDKPIVLCGLSMGGMVTALAAADLKDEIAGLILIYPALSIPDDAAKGKALGARFDPKNPPETFFTKYPPIRLGRKFITDALITSDWMDRIGDFRGPVLLMHGESDRIVPIIYSEIAAGLYSDVRFVRIPHAGHIFWQPWIKNKALQKIIVFLAELRLHQEKK
ncbi:MAG: alpha/beta fold hydrolase [Mogibacterium sp.]|nr:alpha/beta fold hydrolase [Mogibacterium sp.]